MTLPPLLKQRCSGDYSVVATWTRRTSSITSKERKKAKTIIQQPENRSHFVTGPTGSSASTSTSSPPLPPPPASAPPGAHVQHYRRAGTVTRRGRRARAQTLVRRRAPPAPNCIIEHLINVYCNIEARQHARNCPTGATASIVERAPEV